MDTSSFLHWHSGEVIMYCCIPKIYPTRLSNQAGFAFKTLSVVLN